MLALIVARSKNNVIGKGGRIPWSIEGEQKQFKELTTGNIVIMGRRTYEEIGHPLPGRQTIVVSRSRKFDGENLRSAESLEEALEKASEMGGRNWDGENAFGDGERHWSGEQASGQASTDGERNWVGQKASAGGGRPWIGQQASAGGERPRDVQNASTPHIFIAGGYGLYKAALPLVDTMYITEVDLTVEDGDTFFPEFDSGDFDLEIGESGGREIKYTRCIYRRKNTCR